MKSLFDAENWLWRPLGVLGDFVMLSLLWAVFSIPLVTLGPASAALYDAAVHGIRRREDTVITRFLTSFRRELRQGILSTLLVLAAAALCFFVPLLVLGQADGMLLAAWMLLGFFLLCVLCWLWPALSRFTMKLGPLHGAALRLAFGHILKSAAMAILWGATVYLGLRYAAPLLVCPALAAWIGSFLIEPVFQQYGQT